MISNLKLLFNVMVLFFISNNVISQVSANANAEGTIVAPISITESGPLEFGNIASSNSPGTVIISLGGNRTATGGVTLPSTTGAVRRAVFIVNGEALYTFAITIPSSHTITHTNNTDIMTINNFISSPSGTGTLDGIGERYLYVAATLNVGASQPVGYYESSTDFDVTVNYN